MTTLPLILIALVALLAPLKAAVPDEPLWSSFLCAATMLAVVISLIKDRRGLGAPTGGPTWGVFAAVLALLALGLLSLLLRLIVQRGTAFLGPMLHGWAVLVTDFALLWLAYRAAQAGRIPFYALLLVGVLACAVVADLGAQEFLAHWRAHDVGWRVFGTSTPDYLAAYMALLLPVALSVFLWLPTSPASQRLSVWLLTIVTGVITLLALVTLLTTQSRFALLSLTVGVLVFLFALWRASRTGFRLALNSRILLWAMAAMVFVVGLAVARPLLHRLQHPEANSGAFRLWTWKGTAHLIAAHPALGTGIGTYVDIYPRYALTGFTRLAHNGYLQMAAECGIPALLALLAILGMTGVALWRGLASATPEAAPPALLAAISPREDRLLLCGLLGGLAAGAVQNLIDSDWSVFFFGATFWLLAGLGMATRDAAPPMRLLPRPARAALGVLAALLLVLTFTEGVAASYAAQAQAALKQGSLADAEQAYGNAESWDPLNAAYPSDLGFLVFPREGNMQAAERALRRAAALEPSGHQYLRLGKALEASGTKSAATLAYQRGLRADPQSLDLWLALAQISPPAQALYCYQRVTQIEESPVGTARAIDLTEVRFAIADAAVADSLTSRGESAQARADYQRAAALLEAYADEGGTANGQRSAMIGGHSDPQADKQMRALYAHVMQRWIALAPAGRKAALEKRLADYGAKFNAVIAKSGQPGIL